MSRRLNKPDTPADIDLQTCLKDKTSFIVVAGAGSGKTTSLIKALKYIDTNEGKALRQQGKRIACITYTTTAEKEILDDVGYDNFFHVSTIHSFLWELVRPFQENIKMWVTGNIQAKIDKLQAEKVGFEGRRVQQRTKDKNDAEILRYQGMAAIISGVNEFRYETGSNYLQGILGHNDIIAMVPDLISSSQLMQSILAQKYPYFFIDESQDTIPRFIDSMKVVDRNMKKFCLGFFGDPMQKIYMTGAGAIAVEDGWKKISKPENFRCATDVLDVINKIRAEGDDLQQTGGRKEKVGEELQAVKGSAYLFVLATDENRDGNIDLVRAFMSDVNNDPSWVSDEKDADVKVLVIEHRMAAKRLKFGELFAAFNDDSTETLKSGFKEGTLWAVQPFIKFLVPLYHAHKEGRTFEVIELLRRFCPLLQKGYLQSTDKEPKELLAFLKGCVTDIVSLLEAEDKNVNDVLQYVTAKMVMDLDERLLKRLKGGSAEALTDDEETSARVDGVMERYFSVKAEQMLGYQVYINDESAYSTQHSIKGAEYERVLVVLDDEEGNSNSYSYDKLFGIVEPSQRDTDNVAAGNETTLDRTRRLFYVCCSRSLKDLAVILFVGDVEEAAESMKATGIFQETFIKKEVDLLRI